MSKSLITVIIPIYENISYLKFSLKSVIKQTYDNIEIIIVDDGNHKKNKKK